MKFEIITFKKNEFGVRRTGSGYRVGQFAVSPSGSSFKIYELESGKSFLPFSFKNREDACNAAEWLSEIYGEYLILLKEYNPEQVIAMCQLTIPHGREVNMVADKLKDQTITGSEFNVAIRSAQQTIGQEVNVYS